MKEYSEQRITAGMRFASLTKTLTGFAYPQSVKGKKNQSYTVLNLTQEVLM